MPAPPSLCIAHEDTVEGLAQSTEPVPYVRARHVSEVCGWLMSSFVHATILVVLAIMLLPTDDPPPSLTVIVREVEEDAIGQEDFTLAPIEAPQEEIIEYVCENNKWAQPEGE